jgi:PIN domain nuclease of toxin-antitoxin system
MPFTHHSIPHAESFPKEHLPDPFDRMIVSSALEYDLPLVTSDKRIAELGVVQIIW